MVKVADRLVGEGLEDLFLAEGQTVGILGTVEQHGEEFLAHTVHRPLAQAPFLKDYAAFVVDLLVFKSQVEGPVFHDAHTLLKFVGRDGQHVHRFVERSIGIQVIAETDTHRLDLFDHGVAGVVLRPVEGHVLHEVSQTLLVVVLQYAAGIDCQTQFDFVFRQLVLPDVVRKSVFELAHFHGRIHRKRRRGVVLELLGKSRAPTPYEQDGKQRDFSKKIHVSLCFMDLFV